LLTDILGIDYPIIMAPMFLVTNVEMLVESLNNGIAGCVPALNYRTIPELEAAIKKVRSLTPGKKGLGINLIVNKSNIHFPAHLECITKEEFKVDFILTSLGSPKPVIDACKGKGIKVFCDVVDVGYAKKVEGLGCDGLVAVNNKAGGHAGPDPPEKLIPDLLAATKLPVVSAGGIGDYKGVQEMLKLGACGLSIGSPFIACDEAPISKEYKDACVQYGKDDIVFTNKISGTPCTAINTPYV
jgi:nitronate monooxygenase